MQWEKYRKVFFSFFLFWKGDGFIVIKTGYLYHVKDEFFIKMNDKRLMLNHENGGTRPNYLVIKGKEYLWLIPLSSNVSKYKKIRDEKIKKYGFCNTVVISKVAGKKAAFLVQNAFPITEKYIKAIHRVNGKNEYILNYLQIELKNNLKFLLRLKKYKNKDLFFTDIDKIMEKLKKEQEHADIM